MTLDLNKPQGARAYINDWARRGGYDIDEVDPDLDDYECIMLAFQLFMYAETEPALGSSH